jgi:hypothetical protein
MLEVERLSIYLQHIKQALRTKRSRTPCVVQCVDAVIDMLLYCH